ncbi:aminomethyl-transferring glycine dehydrogenase subunit GcvPB [Thermosipho ferrireducens]|uniref:Probable glycine dehydrogenase (decarboxylating) subunit 2 n=1 Tax=Thermosipho ferrireducens TaxID=2571116 RepID=A0ABX7S855_9BACT|nr:aminomethyl-transferring glycine dehydrogenase subunit GcvPB [Thermosipho ferrireducens]QTA38773.1 aminomethyl-transferring glycine dehydrogenase subunit GcvPB [Thermosipho ferrireducens]
MTIFELSKEHRKGYKLPHYNIETQEINIPGHLLRKEKPKIPEVTEIDVVRHYTNLATKNYAVDVGFYPLGSCTMKYNPKINEDVSNFEGFTMIHPHQPQETVQGALKLMFELKEMLCEITGMDEMTLQPSAGAHGELTGILITRAYHLSRGDHKRKKAIVPDSAHGTNPASAAMAGYDVIEIKSGPDGRIDLKALEEALDDEVAVLMLTNPNTLGLFEKDILKIAEMVHNAGALLYYDGANLNALLGRTRPGDMGFDIVHLNLHKTFSTPHGMGGPGSGPVGVKKFLSEFLPVPILTKDSKNNYKLDYSRKNSIGTMRSYYGNFNVMVRAYAYIKSMGKDGLKQVGEMAVLNANYLRKKIEKIMPIAYPDVCMHEFVATCEQLTKETGVKALDIAKRLLDYGFHAPTMYFPLIVHEDFMIEPTETESKDTLDKFAEVLETIFKEAREKSELVKNAPYTTPVKRLDDVTASRKPIFRFKFGEG